MKVPTRPHFAPLSEAGSRIVRMIPVRTRGWSWPRRGAGLSIRRNHSNFSWLD